LVGLRGEGGGRSGESEAESDLHRDCFVLLIGVDEMMVLLDVRILLSLALLWLDLRSRRSAQKVIIA
jgi:hypothetical protein